MSDVFDARIKFLMLNKGIIPFNLTENLSIKKILDSLPPEEAYKLKRKYRKLWRGEFKKSQEKIENSNRTERHKTRNLERLKKSYVAEGKEPNGNQLATRRMSVYSSFVKSERSK